MDEEKKEKLDNSEEDIKKEAEATEQENVSEEYVPEQLDDDEFEKEKSKIKAEKEAKKALKKAEKSKKKGEEKEILLDEEGNPIKRKRKKSEKITIAVIVIIILAIVIGVAGYLIYSLNRPENAILDFFSYVNEEDWDNAINLVDIRGYLTMTLIDMESEDDENTSYIDYENKYNTVFDELAELGYDEVENSLEYGQENYTEIMSGLFTDTTITVDSVDSVERIGDTDLYRVSVNLVLSDDTGTYADQTSSYDLYVAKQDGEYKMVGGAFTSMIYYYYETYYAYSTYYTDTDTDTDTETEVDAEETEVVE